MSDIDEQVERALRTWFGKDRSTDLTWGEGLPQMRDVMRDLLAGKFREPLLPTIMHPPHPFRDPLMVYEDYGTNQSMGNTARYFVHCSLVGGVDLKGPMELTKRKAIEAWNEWCSKMVKP